MNVGVVTGLQRIRGQLGLRLRDVAERGRVHVSNVSRYERGLLMASVRTAARLAPVYGLSLPEFLRLNAEAVAERLRHTPLRREVG